MTVRVAVIDANVLYSIELTDLFLTLATHRLVRVHWSETILDEVRRNLAIRPDLTEVAIDYRIERMNLALPDALHGPPPDELVESMPVNAKDRHVLAFAVQVEADCVVTSTSATSRRRCANRTASSRSIPMTSSTRSPSTNPHVCRPPLLRWQRGAVGHR